MPEPVTFHRVVVHAPVDYIATGPATGCRVITPPAGAFDPARVRVFPVGEVRPGDTVIGTIQPYYDHLLRPLDRAQWVSYFSHTCHPQEHGARPFNPRHCSLCAHHADIRGAGPDWWTVDGCTTYRPDSLLLVIPRDLATL